MYGSEWPRVKSAYAATVISPTADRSSGRASRIRTGQMPNVARGYAAPTSVITLTR